MMDKDGYDMGSVETRLVVSLRTAIFPRYVAFSLPRVCNTVAPPICTGGICLIDYVFDLK